MTFGKPGKRSPCAARLACAAFWLVAVVRLGRSSLSSFHFAPRAATVLSLCSSRPRLFLNPRSMASLKESGNVSEVALPCGTLPVKGFWPRLPPAPFAALGADGMLLEYPLLVWPSTGRARRRRFATMQRIAIAVRGVNFCGNCFMELRSFASKRGSTLAAQHAMLIQFAAL